MHLHTPAEKNDFAVTMMRIEAHNHFTMMQIEAHDLFFNDANRGS